MVRDVCPQRPPADVERLEVAAAGVRRAAQDERAVLGIGEERFDRVVTEVRVERDDVCAVAIERLACVELRGGADVAALRVEDQQATGMFGADVRAQPLELIFGAGGREVRELRFERAGPLGGGVDDLAAKAQNRVWRVADRGGQACRIRIEADAQRRAGGGPRRAQPVEWRARCRRRRLLAQRLIPPR